MNKPQSRFETSFPGETTRLLINIFLAIENNSLWFRSLLVANLSGSIVYLSIYNSSRLILISLSYRSIAETGSTLSCVRVSILVTFACAEGEKKKKKKNKQEQIEEWLPVIPLIVDRRRTGPTRVRSPPARWLAIEGYNPAKADRKSSNRARSAHPRSHHLNVSWLADIFRVFRHDFFFIRLRRRELARGRAGADEG